MGSRGQSQAQQRITAALTLAVYADWLFTGAVPGHAVAQLLTLARHLTQGGIDEDRLAADMAATAWTQRDGAPVSGTQRILAAITAGAAWWEAAPAYRNLAGSWGSDAAVRAGAAGLLPASGIGAVAQTARRSAIVTHTHPHARDAAAVHAAAVALAAAGGDFDDLDADKIMAVLAGQSRTTVMRAQLKVARQLGRDRATPHEAASALICGRSAAGAAGAALAAYLMHPREPLAAISWAQQMGPQWHAAAVMTATLGGAHNPHTRPPVTWVRPAPLMAYISVAAQGLAATPPVLLRHRRSGSLAAVPRTAPGPVVTQLS